MMNHSIPMMACLRVAAFVGFLMFGGLTPSANAISPIAPVFPPESVPYGRTHGEWGGVFFQQLVSDPDTFTGCSFGQVGQVHVLQATGTDEPGEFECTVSTGTAFLCTVGAAWFGCPFDCGPGGAAPNGTIQELRMAADEVADLVTIAECEVDGVPVRDVLSRYRAQSPVFSMTVHPDNFLGLPPGDAFPNVVDGFFVMVKPLPPGEHVIHFRSVLGDPESPVAVRDATHRVTVALARTGEALTVEPSTWGSIKAAYR